MSDQNTIIYVDMDDVLCAYLEGFVQHQAKHPELAFPQSQPGLYRGLEPLPGAIEGYKWLHEHPNTDVFILTAPSVKNPHCYSEKREWVEMHLGIAATENLIISPHKHLNKGHYLIDDMASGKGQDKFEGELLLFGSKDFPNWNTVIDFFKNHL
ncbi:MAG: hypothetical protein KBT72_05050 [Zhongshania sp.]|nr:hypothetical protein [Zhongshania sp.]